MTIKTFWQLKPKGSLFLKNYVCDYDICCNRITNNQLLPIPIKPVRHLFGLLDKEYKYVAHLNFPLKSITTARSAFCTAFFFCCCYIICPAHFQGFFVPSNHG